MILARYVLAGLAFASVAGVVVHHERRRDAEIQALTREVAAMHALLGAERGWSAPPPLVSRCAFDAEAIQSMAVGVAGVLAHSPSGAAAVAPSPSAAPAPTNDRTAEQEAALVKAGAVLDSALAGGRLTNEDMMKIQTNLSAYGANQPETQAMNSRIAQAINLGKLVPDGPR